MYLHTIQLVNFRNYAEASFGFSRQVTAFTGLNGSGKTNLLDAIYYLSALRSFLLHADQHHLRHGTEYFSIRGEITRSDIRYVLFCRFRTGEGKLVSVDGKPYQRFSEHVGKYPMVLIAPQDMELITGGSEIRRKFIDQVISQVDASYLQDLMVYQHTLQQRNSLLSHFHHTQTWDEDLLLAYDEKLIETGSRIVQRRALFTADFQSHISNAYEALSGREKVSMHYLSDISDHDFATLLLGCRSRDRALQRTTVGPHRDDFVFRLDNYELRKTASQGQQKSFIAALKLAQYIHIRLHTGFPPVLLMDDLFDKLDDARVNRLLKLLISEGIGQVFITDARGERTRQALIQAGLDFEMVELDKNLQKPQQ